MSFAIILLLTFKCVALSPQRFPRNAHIIAIAMEWSEIICIHVIPGSVTRSLRSEFTFKWWSAAKANQIDLSFVTKWNSNAVINRIDLGPTSSSRLFPEIR
jgi:hypothetical protein